MYYANNIKISKVLKIPDYMNFILTQLILLLKFQNNPPNMVYLYIKNNFPLERMIFINYLHFFYYNLQQQGLLGSQHDFLVSLRIPR